MSKLRSSNYCTLLSAQTANGVGTIYGTTDFRHMLADIATASLGVGGTLTVRFQGSIGSTPPSFGTAASVSNRWSYIELIDTSNGTIIDGTVGVTIAGANDLKKVELNVNGLDYVCAEVSGYSGPGSVTVFARALNDN